MPSSTPSPSPSSPPQPPESNSQSLLVPPSPPESSSAAPKPILLAIPVPTQKKPQAVQWTPEETANLIQAYQEKWYSLKRGQLKAHQWEEVTITVAARCGYDDPTKTSTQCRHKMEKLRKRYRAEKRKGGRSIWPFFDLMERMECGAGSQPISARPVNMVRFPNSVPKYVSEDEEDNEDEDDHERLNSRSRSINNLLRKPTMVTRFPRTNILPKREELIPPDTDEDDDDDDELVESKERNGVGEKRLLLGLAAEMRGFVKRIARVEKKKMEMMKEMEKRRMEMESKWMKMIMDSQSKMMDTIDKWSTGGPQKKMKIRTVSQM